MHRLPALLFECAAESCTKTEPERCTASGLAVRIAPLARLLKRDPGEGRPRGWARVTAQGRRQGSVVRLVRCLLPGLAGRRRASSSRAVDPDLDVAAWVRGRGRPHRKFHRATEGARTPLQHAEGAQFRRPRSPSTTVDRRHADASFPPTAGRVTPCAPRRPGCHRATISAQRDRTSDTCRRRNGRYADLLALPAATAPAAEALPLDKAIAAIPQAAESHTGYSRAKFTHWNAGAKPDDGCDTRNEVLVAEAVSAPTVEAGCRLEGGTWWSYYDARELGTAAGLDVEHMVPLAEAWASGASQWTAARREAYANDLGDARALVESRRRPTAARASRTPHSGCRPTPRRPAATSSSGRP